MKKTKKVAAIAATSAAIAAAIPGLAFAGSGATVTSATTRIVENGYNSTAGTFDTYTLDLAYTEGTDTGTIETTYNSEGFFTRLTVESAEEFVNFGTDKTLDGVTLETSLTNTANSLEQSAIYTLTNTGTSAKTVTLATGADIQMAGNTKAFAALGLTSNGHPTYTVAQDSSRYSGFGATYALKFNTDPTSAWLGSYRDLEDNLTTKLTLSKTDFLTYSAASEGDKDSALAFSWTVTLAPGENVTYQANFTADTAPLSTITYKDPNDNVLGTQKYVYGLTFSPLAVSTAPVGQHSYWYYPNSDFDIRMYSGTYYEGLYSSLTEGYEPNELVELENNGDIDLGVEISSDLEEKIADFLETSNSNLYYQPTGFFEAWLSDDNDDYYYDELGLAEGTVLIGTVGYNQALYYYVADEDTGEANDVPFDFDESDITSSMVLPGDIDASNLHAYTWTSDDNGNITYTPVAITYDYDTHELTFQGANGYFILVDEPIGVPDTGYKPAGTTSAVENRTGTTTFEEGDLENIEIEETQDVVTFDPYTTFNADANPTVIGTTFYNYGYASFLKVGSDETLADFGEETELNGVTLNIAASENADGSLTVTYTIKNTTTAAQTVSVASASDVSVDAADEAALYRNSDKSGFKMMQDISAYSGFGTTFDIALAPAASSTWIGEYWSLVYYPNHRYDTATATHVTRADGIDSALAYSWTNTLAAGETRTYTATFSVEISEANDIEYYSCDDFTTPEGTGRILVGGAFFTRSATYGTNCELEAGYNNKWNTSADGTGTFYSADTSYYYPTDGAITKLYEFRLKNQVVVDNAVRAYDELKKTFTLSAEDVAEQEEFAKTTYSDVVIKQNSRITNLEDFYDEDQLATLLDKADLDEDDGYTPIYAGALYLYRNYDYMTTNEYIESGGDRMTDATYTSYFTIPASIAAKYGSILIYYADADMVAEEVTLTAAPSSAYNSTTRLVSLESGHDLFYIFASAKSDDDDLIPIVPDTGYKFLGE